MRCRRRKAQIIALSGDGLDGVLCPLGQVGRQLVIHPLALASVAEQTLRAQQGQVARNFRLGQLQLRGQIAHTTLTIARQHTHDVQTGLVGQKLEQTDHVYMIHNCIYVYSYI